MKHDEEISRALRQCTLENDEFGKLWPQKDLIILEDEHVVNAFSINYDRSLLVVFTNKRLVIKMVNKKRWSYEFVASYVYSKFESVIYEKLLIPRKENMFDNEMRFLHLIINLNKDIDFTMCFPMKEKEAVREVYNTVLKEMIK